MTVLNHFLLTVAGSRIDPLMTAVDQALGFIGHAFSTVLLVNRFALRPPQKTFMRSAASAALSDLKPGLPARSQGAD